MAIDVILAMTAAEIQSNAPLPPKLGYMACHFSPCHTGLSNCPSVLPEGSLLILNDYLPMDGHDPGRILEQVSGLTEQFSCCGVLLDFQRPENTHAASLTRTLVEGLSCPVAVSQCYAASLPCPVFLPPVPPDAHLRSYIARWQDREVWLDIAHTGAIIELTADGTSAYPTAIGDTFSGGHRDERLHCHYQITLADNAARFTLWRTADDLQALIEEADSLGISTAIGLWQELDAIL